MGSEERPTTQVFFQATPSTLAREQISLFDGIQILPGQSWILGRHGIRVSIDPRRLRIGG